MSAEILEEDRLKSKIGFKRVKLGLKGKIRFKGVKTSPDNKNCRQKENKTK